ncbi:hypothetical protein BDR06DRAFT_951127 [Suillus hirtellus]|nr:hypothetical protein BDR06DRAFT_951127 [Suillus hirtellus]
MAHYSAGVTNSLVQDQLASLVYRFRNTEDSEIVSPRFQRDITICARTLISRRDDEEVDKAARESAEQQPLNVTFATTSHISSPRTAMASRAPSSPLKQVHRQEIQYHLTSSATRNPRVQCLALDSKDIIRSFVKLTSFPKKPPSLKY